LFGCPNFPLFDMTDWEKERQNAHELQPSHRRHVLGTEKYVMRIPLRLEETDYFGGTHDVELTRLHDINLVQATKVVREFTSVPIPNVIHYDRTMTVLEKIEGVDLDSAWDRVSPRQLAGIKLELQSYIKQLWTIPNLASDIFAVGTLCDTHEILFGDRAYPHQGPFRTTAEYRLHVPGLFGRNPHFPQNVKPVFDHMDWFQSNIIILPNLDKIAGIIDWEYAGFIPDPQDMHVGDVPIDEWRRPEWANIFEGLEQPRLEMNVF